MSDICVVSARRKTSPVAQFCAEDFENAIADASGAPILAPLQINELTSVASKLAVYVALSFREIEDLLLSTKISSETQAVGYVFGAYPHAVAKRRNPLVRLRDSKRRSAYSSLSRLYIGINDGLDTIADALQIPISYLPMAANVLEVDAAPLSKENHRPIPVSAFGRQHLPTMVALANHFNRPDSQQLFYATNFLRTDGLDDARSYRAMFWQILRLSKISLAFDQMLAPNPSGAHLSYVGPRWFESLAAGNVVVGCAPRSQDASKLLNWKDATIDLSTDPESALEEVLELLGHSEKLERISMRNLSHMNASHDWRHRLHSILNDFGMIAPDRLASQIADLADRAASLQPTKTLTM